MTLALALLIAASCRFQDLTPGSNRHDEAAAQAAVAGFYQALAARDGAALGRWTLPAATVLISSAGTGVLVPVRTMIDVPEHRNEAGGAHVVRAELHIDGDVATDRVVVDTRIGGRREYEATDLLTLARRGREWHVAQAALGAWRTRSAP